MIGLWETRPSAWLVLPGSPCRTQSPCLVSGASSFPGTVTEARAASSILAFNRPPWFWNVLSFLTPLSPSETRGSLAGRGLV